MKEVETVLKSFEEDTLPDSIYVDTLKVVEELRKEDKKHTQFQQYISKIRHHKEN